MRYTAGPAGPLERRCWACGHVWTPGEGPPGAAAAVDDPVVRAAIERLDGRVLRVRLRRSGR